VPLTYFGTTPSQVRAADEPLTFSYVSSSAINETIGLAQAAGEIDVSGRLRASLRRSRHQLNAARAGTLVARRQLVLETVDAYYGLVLARQRRRLAEETLSLAEGFLKVTEGMMQRGEGEESDVLRAKAQISTRRDELEQARAGESAAMDALRVFTGVDFATPIDVSRIAQDLPTASDFGSYTDELVKSRPELSQIDAQKRAALEEARIARAERLPQLSYTLNGGFDAADFKPLKRYAGGSATVTLTIPIFDFGARKSRQTQAGLRAQQLDAQRENALRLLKQEFYTSRATALSALVRIRETEAGAEAAQQNMTLIFARYRAKKATITDVVDAQAAYAEARIAYFQAIIDYRTSRIRLESTLGQ
jgi:outer membrane protein TolC